MNLGENLEMMQGRIQGETEDKELAGKLKSKLGPFLNF